MVNHFAENIDTVLDRLDGEEPLISHPGHRQISVFRFHGILLKGQFLRAQDVGNEPIHQIIDRIPLVL
jgi:hypothetical protein